MKRVLITSLVIGVGIVRFSFLSGSLSPFAKSESPKVTSTKLTIPPESLDLGEIWENDSFEVKLPITNQTGLPNTISRWKTSCDCQKVVPESLSLQPKETQFVSLFLDLSPRSNVVNLDVSREVAYSLAPQFESETKLQEEIHWTIRGVVKPWVRASRSVTLPRVSDRTLPVPVYHLPIELLGPIQSYRAEATHPVFSVQSPPVERTGGQRRIELTFDKDLTWGCIPSRLLWSLNSKDLIRNIVE